MTHGPLRHRASRERVRHAMGPSSEGRCLLSVEQERKPLRIWLMMHLDHRIPWNTLAGYFILARDSPQYNGQTSIFPRKPGTRSNKHFEHFGRVLSRVAQEFATTVVSSCNTSTKAADTTLLFTPSVLNHVQVCYGLEDHRTNALRHNPLNVQYARLQYWIARASKEGEIPSFTTSDGDLADAIKTLIAISADSSDADVGREAFAAVWQLATHPRVPLHSLDNLSWGHGFGVSCVLGPAVEMYILLNLVFTIRFRDGSNIEFVELEAFKDFARRHFDDFDYPSQNLPHWSFWMGKGLCTTGELSHARRAFETLATQREMRRYAQTCFGIIYRYYALLQLWYGEDAAKNCLQEEFLQAVRRWKVKC